MTTIDAARVLTPGGVVGPASVHINAGRITSLTPTLSAPDRTLVPGFVDLQCNGAGGIDVGSLAAMPPDDAVDAWRHLDAALLAAGTTTWLPTLVSAPLDAYAARLERLAALGATGHTTAAGVHLEGPFLAIPGAHDPGVLCDPDLDWLAALPASVHLVTLAPERSGAIAAVEALHRRGIVVALGHTAAPAATLDAAVAAGARMVTHLFNGMPPFHHRTPGPAGHALLDDRLVAGLIADGVHVAPEAIALAFRTKPAGGVALVSDRVGGPASLPDGTLAGATHGLDRGVRTAVAAGVDLAVAAAAASTVPARLLGLADRGRIEPGAVADLVALHADLTVEATWIGGVLRYGEPQP